MARERSGTVAWDPKRGCWRARLTLNDGSRPWVDLPEKTKSAQAQERARERARALTERARSREMTATDFGIARRYEEVPSAPAVGETCDT